MGKFSSPSMLIICVKVLHKITRSTIIIVAASEPDGVISVTNKPSQCQRTKRSCASLMTT